VHCFKLWDVDGKEQCPISGHSGRSLLCFDWEYSVFEITKCPSEVPKGSIKVPRHA